MKSHFDYFWSAHVKHQIKVQAYSFFLFGFEFYNSRMNEWNNQNNQCMQDSTEFTKHSCRVCVHSPWGQNGDKTDTQGIRVCCKLLSSTKRAGCSWAISEDMWTLSGTLSCFVGSSFSTTPVTISQIWEGWVTSSTCYSVCLSNRDASKIQLNTWKFWKQIRPSVSIFFWHFVKSRICKRFANYSL